MNLFCETIEVEGSNPMFQPKLHSVHEGEFTRNKARYKSGYIALDRDTQRHHWPGSDISQSVPTHSAGQ